MKTSEMREKRAALAKQAGEILTLAKKEDRDLTSDDQQKFDDLHAEIESMKTKIDTEERQENLNAELERSVNDPEQRGLPGRGDTGKDEDSPEARELEEKRHSAAFRNFLIGGAAALEPEERAYLVRSEKRAQSVGTNTAGGFLVPTGFRQMIETALLQWGGMRQSRVTIMKTNTGNDLEMPTSNDTGNSGALLAENTQDSEQDLTVGSLTLGAYKYTSKIIRVSLELLQDSAFNFEAFLSGKLGERLGRITNNHFTVGTGSGQPKGIVTGASLGKTGSTGQTVSITYNDLVDLEHSVDPAYRKDAEWMFHDNTLKILKKLVDADGRPLWASGIAVGAPDQILSKDYVINQDMAVMAANAKSVLFGDMSKYFIRDVMEMNVIRLVERYADFFQIGFIGFSRHDGDLLDAGTNPIKYYVNSAT